MNEIIQWRRAGKAYLTEVDHVTVAVSAHPAGGWQWCTNRDKGPSGYDPGLADAKEHAVQFTRLWLSERELEVSLQALKEEHAMLRDTNRELREARTLDNDEAARLYDFARNKGEALERQAVVAWLREEYDTDSTRTAADEIERGEHRREEGAWHNQRI